MPFLRLVQGKASRRFPADGSNYTRHSVNNIIAFPPKVFRDWGPIAQALSRYLHGLGATGGEANDIIGRLQVKWVEYGLPLTCPALRTVPRPPLREVSYRNAAGVKFHSRDMPRNVAFDKARSLFELAELDYAQSKSADLRGGRFPG